MRVRQPESTERVRCELSLNKQGFREKVLKRGPLFVDGVGEESTEEGIRQLCGEEQKLTPGRPVCSCPKYQTWKGHIVAPLHERKTRNAALLFISLLFSMSIPRAN